MNALLARQLSRCSGTAERPPEDWAGFLAAIEEAYESADQRREQSMDEVSRELTERCEQFRKQIADRERVDLDLRLKQKLESVGQLAAGIAHEINTPVQYVSDSMHFLRDAFTEYRQHLQRLRDPSHGTRPSAVPGESNGGGIEAAGDAEENLAYLDEHVPRALDRVIEGAARIASIVRAVKEFAHPDQGGMAPSDINVALASTITIATNEYRYVADLETHFGPLPQVRCQIGDLNQVFLNLIVNAAHAIAGPNGRDGERRGSIVVRSSVLGEDVVISVSDNGSGIPQAIADRVFDPFFTTREVGQGTGQGLAICRAIVVEKHGGTLTFETDVGRGTTFFVRIPIAGPATARAAA